jgi:DNA modification methylase
MSTARIMIGDALEQLQGLPDGSVQTCITSPPYWGLRDYGNDGQLGLEPTPDEYVAKMVAVFREVRRVLADDGTLWLNLGDSYASGGGSAKQNLDKLGERLGCGGGHKHSAAVSMRAATPIDLKPKDLVGIPWRVAFALQADGWWLRQDIIWHKPNPMPESVTDRCTKAHEYLFLLSKSTRYFYNASAIVETAVSSGPRGGSLQNDTGREEAIGMGRVRWKGHRANDWNETGRNKRSVWTIATKPYCGAHFAVMPADLVEPCVLAGSKTSDTVLDPFTGSGTVGMVALRHGREFVGVELNPDYASLAESRIFNDGPLLNEVVLEYPTPYTPAE